MTTGNRNYDMRITYPQYGYMKAGETRYAQWNGGDAISPTTPRSGYERVSNVPRPYLSRKQFHIDWEMKHGATRYEAEQSWYARNAEKRRARKLVVLPPRNYTKTILTTTSAIFAYKPSKNVLFSNAVQDPWGGVHPPVDTGKEYKVIAKLREKAYGSGFNPAVFTAEGQMAFKMIGDAATSLGKALESLKRKDPKGVAKALLITVKQARAAFKARRDMSGRWLELQYGWLPLVNDMEEAGKYIGEMVARTSATRTKIVARKTWSEESSAPLTAAAGVYQYTNRVTVFQLQYIVYGFQKSPTYVPSLQTVATVAWEKTPWSFVADWVIPIGSYLEACRTSNDLKGTVVRTLKRDTIITAGAFGTGTNFRGWVAAPNGEFMQRSMKLERTVSEEISPPSPVKGMADSLEFLTWRRAANAVALLTQRFGTRRK